MREGVQRVNIGMIVDRPPSPIMADVIERLADRRVEMHVIDSETALVNLNGHHLTYDWYLLKGGSASALALGGMLHTLGARLMHSYLTTVILRNKLAVMQALASCGVPVPETYLVTRAEQIPTLLTSGAVVLKPNDGRRGEGIRLIRDETELDGAISGVPLLVQRYCPPDGPHPEPGKTRFMKVYRIGDRICGVWRSWPIASWPDRDSEPCDVPDVVRGIVLAVGEAFDLTLYGVDIVFSGESPYVVDVPAMGSCTGVPDASKYLADYFLTMGERLCASAPPGHRRVR
ncbi:hypothetical protein L0Y59_01070 [Candidatus Uhrbacteria bacterium]|nr:hypothetical protein [Candidatus Uhrbacteria bacterium]